MNIKNFTYSIALLALFAFAGTASAQTTGAAATLTMTATVEDSMQLIISTNATPVGTTVTPGTVDTLDNAFTLDFGAINGLGLGSRSTGVSVAADVNGALYTTPINVTPIFSGFSGTSRAAITVRAGGSDNDGLAGEGSSALNVAPLGMTAGAAVITGANSESLNRRFVSFFVARTQPTGNLTASFIYEMTVDAP
jgi:hypothetical protein